MHNFVNCSDSADFPGDRKPLAVDVKEVARLLGISPRHVHKLDTDEKLPRPLRLGGCVRWELDEIVAWMKAGAPPRAKWEETKAGRKGAQP